VGSNEAYLPKRILFVGTKDFDIVRLCISNGKKAKYAALSHRWGQPEKIACHNKPG
jgi:hypothetical protein